MGSVKTLLNIYMEETNFNWKPYPENIPVSGFYLITIKSNSGTSVKLSPFVKIKYPKDKDYRYIFVNCPNGYKVTAWAEAPKPYNNNKD